MPVPAGCGRHLSPLSRMGPLCTRSEIYRTSRSHAVQHRTLWWWGAHGHRILSPADEELEERIRRHHKIMRSRYTKVLRRRALWESDDTHHWPWRKLNRFWSSRHCDYKDLSSKGTAGEKGHDAHVEAHETLRETTHKDFDSFRAAVDRAIARDPYGTLFGRRLDSPPTSNNSSWTSFSWMSAPQEPKADRSRPSTESEPTVKDPVSPLKSSTAHKSSETSSTRTYEDEGYEYDPISMRKVPIKKQSLGSGPDPVPDPPKPFLHSLFSEHGFDVPVKTYKPFKVYGHDGSQMKREESQPPAALNKTGASCSSSRKLEFQDLLVRSKGNNLDTTAHFTESGPEHIAEQATGEPVAPRKVREFPEPDDHAPLFSGTTYEGRVRKEDNKGSPDWLAKEGFREGFEPSHHSHVSPISPDVEISGGKVSKPLQPALDRMQANPVQESKSESSRLQTALDRSIGASKRAPEVGSVTPHPLQATQHDLATQDESITGPARSSKQETDSDRVQDRSRLEADYEARQKNDENISEYLPKNLKVEAPTSKLTKTLNNVWEHIREYPNGIVAKTMKSVAAFNDNYKKYVRPEKVQGLTDKLVFQDESLSKTASIFKRDGKPRRFEPTIPSPAVLEAVEEQKQRTAKLREATQKARRDVEVQNAQISRLATELQALYENEYGPIDAHHRQTASSTPKPGGESTITSSLSSPNQPSSSKPHPLSSASLKPGVTNPEVDRHIGQFEPKFAELVDSAKAIHARLQDMSGQMKQLTESRDQVPSTASRLNAVIQGAKEVRRKLHEAQSMMRAIESGRPEIAWNAPHMSGLDFGKKRIDLKTQQKAEETEVTPDKSNQDAPNAAVKCQSSLPTEVAKQKAETAPELTKLPPGSTASAETRKTRVFDSQYLILSYDPSADTVNFSPMNQPTSQMPRSTNPIGILGRLKHAPEYLKHFQTVHRAGYSLFNGNDNMLIFQKNKPQLATDVPSSKAAEPHQLVAYTIPAANSAPSDIDGSDERSTQHAANVLDEIPNDVNPFPGPTAPTAPPSNPTGSLGGQSRVRRQENVFSGTIRSGAPVLSSNKSEAEPSTLRANTRFSSETEDNLWTRFVRGMRKTILTIVALGGAAYGIGFVAEGMGAHTQQQKGIEDSEAQGPRRRIVMTGQRPGIFSTESSR